MMTASDHGAEKKISRERKARGGVEMPLRTVAAVAGGTLLGGLVAGGLAGSRFQAPRSYENGKDDGREIGRLEGYQDAVQEGVERTMSGIECDIRQAVQAEHADAFEPFEFDYAECLGRIAVSTTAVPRGDGN